MSNKAAGYKCPFCGYDHEMDITGWITDEDDTLIGSSLMCPECHYEWIESRE